VTGARRVRIAWDTGVVAPPSDPFGLRSASVRDGVLDAEVVFTGGYREHRFDLLATERSVTADGVVVRLVLIHRADGDDAKAIVQQRLRFDLRPLTAACREELDRAGGSIEVHLDGRRYRLGP
jgi:hypothetical protein